MPNGFTSALYDGDQSLRDYLMGVGRGMSFSIMQRDEGNGPVRLLDEKSSWYSKALREAQQRLDYLIDMTTDQIVAQCSKEYSEACSSWKKYNEEQDAIKSRYEYMLAQVEEWNCPPVLSSTKESAIKYIEESLDYDCKHYTPQPQNFTPEEWHEREIKNTKDNIEYYRLEEAKEIARHKERNMYIKTFLDSLPEE